MNNRSTQVFLVVSRVMGVMSCFLIVAALTLALHHYLRPSPLGQDRAATRTKALGDMRGGEDEGLSTPAWLDRSKGTVRLPIAAAMNLTLSEWSWDPAAARSNLIARIEMATAPPPRPTEVSTALRPPCVGVRGGPS